MNQNLLSDIHNKLKLPQPAIQNVINMLDSGNTVPFISRYRKEMIRGLEPEQVSQIKSLAEQLRGVYSKISLSIKKLEEKGVKTKEIEKELMDCKTTEDVEVIMEPFKEVRKSAVQKALEAGIGEFAESILNFGTVVDFQNAHRLVKDENYKDPKAFREAVIHIISDTISKNVNITKFSKKQLKEFPPFIHTREKKDAKLVQDFMKYNRYFNFSQLTTRLFPHNILAINRAESKNVISVKLDFNKTYIQRLWDYIFEVIFPNCSPKNKPLLNETTERAIHKLLIPKMTRYTRSEMLSYAEEASVNVFKRNLRRILMSAPLTTNTIGSENVVKQDLVMSDSNQPGDRLPVIGIDPGFTHGCKWAACDAHGGVLTHGVFYHNSPASLEPLLEAVKVYQINIFAVGNGKGCRQVEQMIIEYKRDKKFPIEANILYTFVPENGASIYSATPLAKQELPDLDITIRGAVSIARRLQDPLAELVKIEPKHLGVGMYQHDLKKTQLDVALDSVVEECISYVGIDANSAPYHMLQKIAGLGPKKATAIIEYRKKHGSFKSRNDLKKVPGIGPQTFAQISGFLRIKPEIINNKSSYKNEVKIDLELEVSESDEDQNMIDLTEVEAYIPPEKRRKLKQTKLDENSFNPLDQTAVHPMTYEVTTRLIESLHWSITDVGKKEFIKRMDILCKSSTRDSKLKPFCTEEFGLETLRDIITVLARPLDFDERPNQFAPIFRDNPVDVSSLRENEKIRGFVTNVTTFGAFVDIGLNEDCLLQDRQHKLKIYDRVTVTINKIIRGQITLKDNYEVIK